MLLDDIVEDSRWDMTYLGMQIMVEGLALAAFGFMHQMTTEPLLKQLLRYVMSDEARHVAFGVLSLKEYYAELSDAEMLERQEFAFEAAVRMRDRFLQQEVWDRMGIDPKVAAGLVLQAPQRQLFQSMLFSKIVPNCKKLGLLDRNDDWLRGQVHRARRHPVRGLGRHRRGVPRGARSHVATRGRRPGSTPRARRLLAAPPPRARRDRRRGRRPRPHRRRPAGRPARRLDASAGHAYSFVENAASNAAAGASNARRRTNSRASGAPTRRSMPASSHSTEIGPS